MCDSRKYIHHPHRKDKNFQKGGELFEKIPSVGRYMYPLKVNIVILCSQKLLEVLVINMYSNDLHCTWMMFHKASGINWGMLPTVSRERVARNFIETLLSLLCAYMHIRAYHIYCTFLNYSRNRD